MITIDGVTTYTPVSVDADFAVVGVGVGEADFLSEG